MTVEQIGRYQILEWLGGGGMGEVYQALDPDLNRKVAVKVVKLSMAIRQEEGYERFKREVQAAARLNHPHIVTMYDVDLEHDPPYVVMELLAGGTLSRRLRSGPLPWSQVLVLLRPLAEALAYAHQAGIIHRDLKPGNVMFGNDQPDSLKLVDFGLARQQNDEEGLTKTGTPFGTPGYMSPEQAKGEETDARTDIFALGIIILEAISGANPLRKGNLTATLLATTSNDAIDIAPLTQQTPREVVRLVKQAVAKERAQRYPTVEALLIDWDRCLDNNLSEATLPSVLTQPSSDPTTQPTKPMIRSGPGINLRSETKTVLRQMFSEADWVAVEMEFGAGLSGSHVFQVRVHRHQKAELPAVVKVGPIRQIIEEWESYQRWVADTLPGVPPIKAAPTLPKGSLWGGLSYTAVGSGTFKVESLRRYYEAGATPDDLKWILGERLYKMIGEHWWLHRRSDPAFQMQAGYDSLLPVNLHLKPADASSSDTAYILSAEQLPTRPPAVGTVVILQGFVVTEVDQKQGEVTLNLPPTPEGMPDISYRLRLTGVTNPDQYQVHQIVSDVGGEVTRTRHDLLLAAAQAALGATVDLTAEQIALPEQPERSLPNPLLAYPDLLMEFMRANLAIIHGDLNLENILVDPDTRHISLIDFATVRRGHALHDLFRLETEVVTKLIPQALEEADLPPTTIQAVYRQLRLATLKPDQSAAFEHLPQALEKPFVMLATIRKMARAVLFNPDDWTEYYRGLTLYLLGALKFKNLDGEPTAPLPKQTAFWAAATMVDLLRNPTLPPEPEPDEETEIEPPPPASAPKKSRVGLVVVVVLVLLLVAGGWLWWSFPDQQPSERSTEAMRAVVIDPIPVVTIKEPGANELSNLSSTGMVFEGDRITTEEGASTTLICANCNEFELSADKTGVISCINKSSQFYRSFYQGEADENACKLVNNKIEDVQNENSQDPISRLITLVFRSRGSRGNDQNKIPLLINPRNTAITTTMPTFIWQPPVEGTVNTYTLTVEVGGAESWSQDTAATQLSYPPDEPPIRPGIRRVTLTADGAEVSCDTGAVSLACTTITVLDEEEMAEVEAVAAGIKALDLSEVGEHVMLAQLYEQEGLRAAAISHLEQATALLPADDSRRLNIHQQLGTLYYEIRLYTPAQENYELAHSLAAQTDDLLAQADAQVGLANTAIAFEENDKAIDILIEAERLYEQAGQPERAEAIAEARQEFEEKLSDTTAD